MEKGRKNQLNVYIFWAALALLIFVSYKIIGQYIIPLISAFILAYLTKPIYELLNKKLKKSVSALICVLLVIIILIIPLGAVIGGITQQAYSTLSDASLESLLEKVSSSSILEKFNFDVENLREKGVAFLINIISTAASYLPSLLISFLVTFMGMYYILLNWDFLSLKLEEYIPFTNKKKIKEEMSRTTKGILYGMLLLGLIEAIIAGLGFALLGVKAYLLAAALIFLLTFIPSIGPALVWLPLAIIYGIFGDYTAAIGILVIGLILSIPIDTLLRGKLLGETTSVHPLLMLIGILGGISIFGLFGFIIGPLILLYTIRIIQEAIKTYT